MRTSFVGVVGCDAVDASPEWLRLHAPGGLETIAWPSIRMAATPVDDGSTTFEGELEPLTKLRDTHDPLWIESEAGTAVVMLEKHHPKRDAIIAAFQQHLGARWQGDRITAVEAMEQMFAAPVAKLQRRRFPIIVYIMIGAVVFMFLLAMIVSRLAR